MEIPFSWHYAGKVCAYNSNFNKLLKDFQIFLRAPKLRKDRLNDILLQSVVRRKQ